MTLDAGISSVESPEEEDSLPFHIPTLLIRIAQKWLYYLLCIIVAAAVGVTSGVGLGSRTYQATATLLYRPSKAVEDPPSLLTLLNLVKIPENVRTVRERMKLGAAEETVAQAISADVQRSTDLLIIRTTWNDPETALNLAIEARDVFIERQVQQRQAKLAKTKLDLEKQLAEVSGRLKVAEQKLKDFTVENNVIDLDKEAQWYLEEVTNLQLLLEQAQVKRKAVNIQSQNMDRIVDQLGDRVKQEQAKGNGASMENLGDINIKVQRLRAAIADDKEQRAGSALLEQKRLELDRAKKLRAEGLISEAELEKVTADYQRQKALSVDTEDITLMKDQIDDLNAKAIPKDGAAKAESAPMLQSMMLKGFEIELEQVSQDEQVAHLEDALKRARVRLNGLPELQRTFAALSREVESVEREQATVEEDLTRVRTALSGNLADFVIASEPTLPVNPIKSNRKVLAIGGFVAMGGAGIFLVLLWVIADFRIYSRPDLESRSGLPALAGFGLNPGPEERSRFGFFAIELRRQVERGSATLVTSQKDGEGKTFLLEGLAEALVHQGFRVARVITNDQEGPSSLKDALEELPAIWSGHLSPEQCRGDDMKSYLKALGEKYDYVFVESPAADGRVEVELLLENCPQALVVVQAGRFTGGEVKELKERLEGAGTKVVGGVLNKVSKAFRKYN
jgi:uncharacterized protein involved in exopolysaccharide biosynthesis